jgi:hypothetical protein
MDRGSDLALGGDFVAQKSPAPATKVVTEPPDRTILTTGSDASQDARFVLPAQRPQSAPAAKPPPWLDA